jgi:alkylmercury lyase-like protein
VLGRVRSRGYWANCLYCAFGIAAALNQDALITTRYGGEGETVQYQVLSNAVTSADVFHLSTPVARWWDNVIFACSSFQPFQHEADADRWCARHQLPKGATMTIPALWSFAKDWYGDYLQIPWRKRSGEAAHALFERHGLTEPFWAVG